MNSNVKSTLTYFDARLDSNHCFYVQRAEILRANQHALTYDSSEGHTQMSPSDNLLILLLQSNRAREKFNIGDTAWAKILAALSYKPVALFREQKTAPSLPFRNGVNSHPSLQKSQSTVISPTQQNTESPQRSSSFGLDFPPNGAIAHNLSAPTPNNDSATRSRRGRLFDLVDDVDEDNDDQVDIVSGMLNTLDMNMFTSNASTDIDIEAISLMGIGSPDHLSTSNGSNRGRNSSSFPFR